MIGVSVRRWALSCAVRPVPPHSTWPNPVSSRLVSDLVVWMWKRAGRNGWY